MQAKAGRRARPFAGYVRVSRVGERDERLRSPEFQTAAIEAKAKAAGVTVEMFEAELDVSGSKRNRAILDAIIERIEAGELAGIVVYALSRLSRLKPRDRIELVERIEGAGGVILSASESFDAATPEGRFQRDLFFSIARLEWERSAEAFAVAKAAAIEAGRPIKPVTPFGYRQAERGASLEVVEAEAELVRQMFELRAGGASYGQVLEAFELATGRSSYRTSVRAMLRNRTYLGELHYGRDVELVNREAHPAIVDVELFEVVQAVELERSRMRGRYHAGKAKSLLAGIARCAGCGRGLVCTRTGRAGALGVYSYKCPADTRHCAARATSVAAELDELVVARVLEWAGPMVDELDEVELAARGDRVVAEHELAKAERSLVAWAEELELEERDPEAYRAGLEARRRRVERRRQELDAAGEASELEVARATIRETLETTGSIEERRELLASVLEAVVVSKSPTRLRTPVGERVELAFRGERVEPGSSSPAEDATVSLA